MKEDSKINNMFNAIVNYKETHEDNFDLINVKRV